MSPAQTEADRVWARTRALLGDAVDWPALTKQMRNCIHAGLSSDGDREDIGFSIYSTTRNDTRTPRELRADWPRDFIGRCLPLAIADAIIEARERGA